MSLRTGLAPCLCLVLSLTVPAGGAFAAGADDASLCEHAIVEGAQRGGVPQQVLHAISLTETGRPENGRLRPWPWAINREGRGYWFPDREKALAFARHSLAEGRKSFDVGCFQINYKYHGHNFPSLEAMFDPQVGADYAAQFLGTLHAEKGDWSAAAGAYHSRTPHYAGIYRARFDRILAGLGVMPKVVSAKTVVAEAEPEVPRKSRTRLTRKPLIINVDPAAFRRAKKDVPEAGGRVETAAGGAAGADALPGPVAAHRLF